MIRLCLSFKTGGKMSLSVQFHVKSHSVHSCMHPRTSTIIVIGKINSCAMAEWNALHFSRVWMSCWVVWSWSRKHAVKMRMMFGLSQECRVIRSRFRLLQRHHFCVPCICSRFPFQTFFDVAPTPPDDVRRTLARTRQILLSQHILLTRPTTKCVLKNSVLR